ncbi:MAG: MaoC/PaaZ C-terminal domain-containing protein, partial [Bacillota bacterium]
MRKISSVEELKILVGQEVAVTDWVAISQERVNMFAEATGDHQWIHTDVERSRKESPYGGTI